MHSIGEFERLLEEYKPTIRFLAYRHYRNYTGVDVNELIHIGNIAVWEGYSTHNPDQSYALNAWIRIKIYQRMIDHMRSYGVNLRHGNAAIRVSLESMREDGFELVANTDELEHIEHKVTVRKLWKRHRGRLTKQEVEVLNLIYSTWDLKNYDIAEILGISAGRVSQLHKNAIKKLRESIKYEQVAVAKLRNNDKA